MKNGYFGQRSVGKFHRYLLEMERNQDREENICCFTKQQEKIICVLIILIYRLGTHRNAIAVFFFEHICYINNCTFIQGKIKV